MTKSQAKMLDTASAFFFFNEIPSPSCAAATWASEGCTLDPSPGHGPVDRPRIGGTAGPAAQLGDGISLKKKNAEAVSNILACDLVILRFSLKDHPLTAP